MSDLSASQKILLYCFYALLALMVIFSILSLKNTGTESYQKCIQQKCDAKGQAFCTKQREISNCCQGANGQLAMTSNNQLTCVF